MDVNGGEMAVHYDVDYGYHGLFGENIDIRESSTYRFVLEYVILEQLVSHLEVIEALPDNQSAHKILYSAETAICSAVNDMLEMVDEDKCGILILLDLSAAFDTVVHELLLNDLRSIGVEHQALEYLKDYLVGRNYCVQLGNSIHHMDP
ncbi:uncharacterized protein [Palaemon carinicauda]|uniref:uncharacterized protein n=1 Tax=Palaemon carinicauda TaxID=392227 RepID=UPI0035B58D05